MLFDSEVNGAHSPCKKCEIYDTGFPSCMKKCEKISAFQESLVDVVGTLKDGLAVLMVDDILRKTYE